MSIPEFKTYREMCEHLATGGAAYRFGNAYPIYIGIVKDGELRGVEQRYHGGSSGECVKNMGGYWSGVDFSADEQQSVNWVLISAEAWAERERKRREAWDRIREENRKRQAATGVYEGKVGQIVPAEKPNVPAEKPRRLMGRWF